MGTMKAAVVQSLAAASSVALAQPPSRIAVPVTVDNYNRAQSDVNFGLTRCRRKTEIIQKMRS